jgi:hypothetical protein
VAVIAGATAPTTFRGLGRPKTDLYSSQPLRYSQRRARRPSRLAAIARNNTRPTGADKMTCDDLFPVVITCKDRIRCLDTTLRGLSATLPETVPVYIANDGSANPEMIRYLTTTDDLLLPVGFYPSHHQEWAARIGPLPEPEMVQGIAGRATIILRETPCGIKNFSDAIRIVLEETGAPGAIRIQDDVAFKLDWYRVLVEGLKCRAAGIVSGFRYFFERRIFAETESPLFGELVQGYTGGILMGITRALATANPMLLHNDITMAREMDKFWIDAARHVGFKVLVSQPGVAQHIGFHSEIFADRREFMVGGDNRLRRVDRSVTPPFAFAGEVRRFCGENRVIHQAG